MLSEKESKIKHFYKYRSVDKWTKKLLVNNELYFAPPSTFNDPFDCKTDFIYKTESRNDWLNWLSRQINRSDEEKKRFLILLDRDMNELTKIMNSSIDVKKLIDSFGILSLSTTNKSILMWSHYAKFHQGICLGFKSTFQDNSIGIEFEDPVGFYPAFKVEYETTFPSTHNLLKDNPNQLTKFFKTKHSDWKYEEEYRLIIDMDKTPKRNIKFKKKALGQVIFGMYISENDKKIVKNLVQKYYIDKGIEVKFFQAKEVPNDYALIIEDDIKVNRMHHEH